MAARAKDTLRREKMAITLNMDVLHPHSLAHVEAGKPAHVRCDRISQERGLVRLGVRNSADRCQGVEGEDVAGG